MIVRENIDLLRSIASRSGGGGAQEPKDHSEEIARQNATNDMRVLCKLISPTPHQADEDEAAVINCLFQDEERFRQGCREAEEQIRDWSIRIYDLLRNFEAVDEGLPHDPDIVELRRWLSLAGRR